MDVNFWKIKIFHEHFFPLCISSRKGTRPIPSLLDPTDPLEHFLNLEPLLQHISDHLEPIRRKKNFRAKDLFIPQNTLKMAKNDTLIGPPEPNGTLFQHGTSFSERNRPFRTQWANKKNFDFENFFFEKKDFYYYKTHWKWPKMTQEPDPLKPMEHFFSMGPFFSERNRPFRTRWANKKNLVVTSRSSSSSSLNPYIYIWLGHNPCRTARNKGPLAVLERFCKEKLSF